MKRPKDRLHRVIVIGATPAGIAATNKLGEIGIPVLLVDSHNDLDKMLSSDEWRLESGVPFNCAHRPGLIRILRNASIQCFMPAEVISVKHNPQGFRVRIKRIPTYVDPERCTLCGRCAEVCPVETFDGKKAISLNSRMGLPGRPVIDKRRQPLCQENCPLGVNAQGYIALTKVGKFKEALELVRHDNILPGICGRVCTHPCEANCRRSDLDEPIAIKDIKRFLADQENSLPADENPIPSESSNKSRRPEKIAVVGSGPSGLAAAADLARQGYSVTIFEKESSPGGLLRYGIGPHRLPRDILDNEIRYIENLGVDFITGHPVNFVGDLNRLTNEYRAVILATGTWADRRLGVPGEKLQGVDGCLSFLTRFYRDGMNALNETVAVIGDGNAAFDMARVLKRLGADVTILSWFPMDFIPADAEEIKAAQEENIRIKYSLKVVEFIGASGRLERLVCMPTTPGEPDDQGIPWPVVIQNGEPVEFKFDRAFVAIGQSGTFKQPDQAVSFNVTKQGYIDTNGSSLTNMKRVYAAGDAVSGPSSVVHAMALGRQAARDVHYDICGEKPHEADLARPAETDYPEIQEDIPAMSRPSTPERQPATRILSFAEVALGLSESQIIFEAERCLQCGVCSECLQCVDVCSPIQAIKQNDTHQEIIEHAGVVIIADPDISPQVKGEDVLRAYGPKMAKSDVNAMMVRGFGAAAKAMVLLSGTSQRPRGHGISFHTPDPGLSPIIRIGVFACRCNDALGWLDSMTEYLDALANQEDIVHIESLNSACVPEGSSSILRTIREKGITRIVLASCVCCPLNFVCSACSDQRSRLKHAIFTGTGISRSMVETCNIRGEALRHVKKDPLKAKSSFIGLIDRSITRSKKLKMLPALARNYNFATAVIGESEAALNSAKTLAEAGLEVFLFGTSGNFVNNGLLHSNIHSFEGAVVKAISGTLGEFQLSVQTDDFEQILQVGSVILGEKSRSKVQYIHQQDLPSKTVASSMQKAGISGVPFFAPGFTSIKGLYLADPPGISVSKRKKGAAAAAIAAAIMPRGPRQSKGFTVVVNEELCRGCGRCINICPYQAVSLYQNEIGGWHAIVDEALCNGCGNCISVCPSNAADSPYRDHAFLEQTLEEILIH